MVFSKAFRDSTIKNRLDSLEQIRLALINTNGNEPNFLKRSNLDLLIEQHKNEVIKAKKYQPNKDFGNIRGIPTKEEAAQSMGHYIKTHKKHYQYWITDEVEKQQLILKTSLPA